VLFFNELMDEPSGIPTAISWGIRWGGMLAAEVAAFDLHRANKLVLIRAARFLEIDAVPIPDLFAAQLTEIAPPLVPRS